VQSVRHQIFPYYLAHYLKSIFDDVKNITNIQNALPDKTIKYDETFLANAEAYAKSRLAEAQNNGIDLRRKISHRVLLPVDEVQLDIQSTPENEKKIRATFYGINVVGLLASTKSKSNKCLVIYNQGHSGIHYYLDYHEDLKARVLERGCDYLSLYMLGYGLNEGEASFPSKLVGGGKFFHLGKSKTSNHLNYTFFFDKERPHLDPLALFLSGHYKIISELSSSYKNITMLGISGGGWYTTVMSGLVPSINLSFSVAGTMPISFKIEYLNQGDYEQFYSPLWRDYDYWDFYFLGLMAENGEFNRRVNLIYNNNDACCFIDPGASHMKTISENVGAKGMKVIVDESLRHSLNIDLVMDIINKEFNL
jgi:hypothetical protein